MRTRFSIQGSIRPSVCRSVGPSLTRFLNSGNWVKTSWNQCNSRDMDPWLQITRKKPAIHLQTVCNSIWRISLCISIFVPTGFRRIFVRTNLFTYRRDLFAFLFLAYLPYYVLFTLSFQIPSKRDFCQAEYFRGVDSRQSAASGGWENGGDTFQGRRRPSTPVGRSQEREQETHRQVSLMAEIGAQLWVDFWNIRVTGRTDRIVWFLLAGLIDDSLIDRCDWFFYWFIGWKTYHVDWLYLLMYLLSSSFHFFFLIRTMFIRTLRLRLP